MILRFSRNQLILIQIIFWLVVCALSFFPIEWHGGGFHPHPRPMHGEGMRPGHHHPPHGHWNLDIALYIVQNISIIIVFYLNYFYLIPKLFSNGKVKSYLFVCVLLMLLVALLPLGFESFGRHFHFHLNPRSFHQTVIRLLAVSLAILIPLAFKISMEHAQADREKTKAELSFLRSQINHHFLFNSLNNIYSLSIQGNKHTSEAIFSLSSIMRHMATATATNKIPLTQELNFIHHYIEIQKLRLSENTKLSYEVSGDAEGKHIGPMLLIPFVENCFKHGVSTTHPSHIVIHLAIQENYIELKTENTIIPQIHNSEIKSGVGLDNVKKRLQFEYANHFHLEQETTNGIYYAYLKLDIL